MSRLAIESLSSELIDILKTMGSHLRMARVARNMTQKDLANRARTSVSTLRRLEANPAKVNIATLAQVLRILQLEGTLLAVAAPEKDEIGKALMLKKMPKRVRVEDPFGI